LGESVFDEIERIKTTMIDPSSSSAKHSTTHSVYFGGTNGRVDTPVYKLENLDPGNKVCGPAVIIDATQTIVLDPRSEAVVTSQHLFITLLWPLFPFFVVSDMANRSMYVLRVWNIKDCVKWMKSCPVLSSPIRVLKSDKHTCKRIEHALRWIVFHIRMYVRGLLLSELHVKPDASLELNPEIPPEHESFRLLQFIDIW
jgi:hypothetical protein